MGNYKVGRKRKALIVSHKIHLLVQLYAKKREITMVEATHDILRSGLGHLLGYKIQNL